MVMSEMMMKKNILRLPDMRHLPNVTIHPVTINLEEEHNERIAAFQLNQTYSRSTQVSFGNEFVGHKDLYKDAR